MGIKDFIKKYPGLFSIAFVEGAIVMAVEILGGNILTAYFGNSIYLWSGILGVSLGGLAIGYFAGAGFSGNPVKRKFYSLLTGIFVLTTLVPFVADGLIPSMLDLDIKTGITVGCIITLMPVMILCGMITPFIIQLTVIKTDNKAGKNAGTVYSVSTAGGILFTFLSGLYFIPEFGLRKSLIIMAGVFLIAGMTYFFWERKKEK